MAPPFARKNPYEQEEGEQDLFWTTYLKDAEEEDKYLPKSWEANTGGILTFVRAMRLLCASFLTP